MRFPDNSERATIIGRTGSGKTVAAAWHLSVRNFDKMPWIIFNFKGDKFLDKIPYVKEVEIKSDPPKTPGLYMVRPLPDETEELDAFLQKVWANEKTGLYFDEGYMVGNSKVFRSLLTQGRSKDIPMIVLTQRPSWITRFVWSESDFFQVFALTNKQDQDTASEFVPAMKSRPKLEKFHSLYHDVKEGVTVELTPVPEQDNILRTFRRRLRGARSIL